MEILVVEDSKTDAKVLQHALSRIGHEVTLASTAEEALRMLRNCNFPIVICDWELPGKDGDDLCRAIRERHSNHYTYFVMLTSRTEKKFVIEGLAAGADDYLTKPFEPQELFFRVRVAERLLSLQGRDLIIFSLAKLAESRDMETGAHLERMREYCRLLTQLMSQTSRYSEVIDADFIASIYLTSPLHDIGKVGIPDSILLKPGKLTKDEFEVMKTHTLIGGETLRAVAEKNSGHGYMRMACEIALTHHEKYDGTGYPNNLAGVEIPLCGRIVAIADVYDALTSKRIYKNAFSHQKACNIIRCESGSHFDPEITQVFLEHHQKFDVIRKALEDQSSDSGFLAKKPPFDVPQESVAGAPIVQGYSARSTDRNMTL